MNSETSSKHSQLAHKDRFAPREAFAALPAAERAKRYREFAQDARCQAERSIEPYKSACLKIAGQFESLAEDIEAHLLAEKARPR